MGKLIVGLVQVGLLLSLQANAESLRCKGDLVDEGNTKAEVMEKCGAPAYQDSFCEYPERYVTDIEGRRRLVNDCVRVDVWTYNPGRGQFWTSVYFTEGKVRNLKYGDRVTD